MLEGLAGFFDVVMKVAGSTIVAVLEGQDVVDSIEQGDTMSTVRVVVVED